jgi:hypothetical protein
MKVNCLYNCKNHAMPALLWECRSFGYAGRESMVGRIVESDDRLDEFNRFLSAMGCEAEGNTADS